MSYTRPPPSSADFGLLGAAYTRPTSASANFQFDPLYSGTGSATIELAAEGAGAHGATGSGAASIDIEADGAGVFTTISIEGTGAVTVDGPNAAGQAAHGAAGTGAVDTDQTAAGASGHGVAGFVDEATVGFAVGGAGAHGVTGAGAATVAGHTAAGQALHLRYELRGEVRDAGILVNRRVRAYNRVTGALTGQADTLVGRFNIPAGFAQDEFYLIPIDLAEAAADWSPPAANRVLSVLALDA